MGTVRTTEKHFVVFYSPGSFVSETSELEIGEWKTREALRLASEITERYGARPFGFDFETRVVTVPEEGERSVTIKTLKTSPRHYINGRVMTLADVEREMPGETILLSNMRGNGHSRIVTGPASGKGNWRWTHVFYDDSVLLDADGTDITSSCPDATP